MKYISLYVASLLMIGATFSIDAKKMKKQQFWPSAKQELSIPGAHIKVRTLSKQETNALFNGKGKKLTSGRTYAIFPIEVTVHNTGSHALMIDANCTNLSQLTTEDIMQIYRKNSTLRALFIVVPSAIIGIGFGLVGFGYILGTMIICAAAKAGTPPLLGAQILGVTAGSGALIAGGSTLGNATSKNAHDYNNDLESQIHQHMFEQRKLIEPDKTVTGLVFVPKQDFRSDFDLTLINTHNTDQNILAHVQLA